MAKKGLNIFNSVKLSAVPSSRFNLSHDNKLSFSMGELVPTTIQECLPGDKWNISVANMLRFAPLIAPVMHKIKVTTDYYFVPNRILWPEWQDWITNKSDVGEAPYIQITGTVLEGSLADVSGSSVSVWLNTSLITMFWILRPMNSGRCSRASELNTLNMDLRYSV